MGSGISSRVAISEARMPPLRATISSTWAARLTDWICVGVLGAFIYEIMLWSSDSSITGSIAGQGQYVIMPPVTLID